MNCRNCGAAMQPVGGKGYFRCGYCGTFEFPPTNTDGVATLGEMTQLPCPVCDTQLGKAAVEGHTVCFCGTCHGLLTTNDEFSGILGKLRAEYADRAAAPRVIDPAELKRRVECPKCRRMMDAHPYGGGGNVVIDTCDRCHLIWLDAGEMEMLARHKPRGNTLAAGDWLLTPVPAGLPPEDAPADTADESVWNLLRRLF